MVDEPADGAGARQLEDVHDVEEHWPVESTEDVFRKDGLPFAIRTDVVRRAGADDEAPFTRLLVEHPGAVVVLALDDQDRAFCLRQYRHVVGRRLLELPAGLLDEPGEAPVDAARRELQEETGLAAESWTELGAGWSSPGIIAEKIHYFLARDLSDVGRGDFEPAHEEADMESLWVPYADLLAACLDGRVEDAPLKIAVLTAQVKGLASHPDGSFHPDRIE